MDRDTYDVQAENNFNNADDAVHVESLSSNHLCCLLAAANQTQDIFVLLNRYGVGHDPS